MGKVVTIPVITFSILLCLLIAMGMIARFCSFICNSSDVFNLSVLNLSFIYYLSGNDSLDHIIFRLLTSEWDAYMQFLMVGDFNLHSDNKSGKSLKHWCGFLMF